MKRRSVHSLTFGGSAQRVDFANGLALIPDSFTVSFWLQTSTYYRNVLGNWNGSGWGMAIGNSGAACFYLYGPGGQRDPYPGGFGGGNVADGAWHHVACVYVRSLGGIGLNMYIYVDGNYGGTTGNNANSSIYMENSSLQLGTYASVAASLIGSLDDVRIYNRALTAAEVLLLYQGWDIRDGLVGDWPLNEGSGTTTADLSGNSNTGTLTNGPTWSNDVPTNLSAGNGGAFF